MKPLAGPAIEVVRDGQIAIEPQRFAKQYIDWMENVRDWCISRQVWWGHRIPVWYCDECGEVIAALDDPKECRKCSSNRLRQDEDVLDTWFSSQLWPFSTLGWPDETPDLAKFYPTTLMVTGYEILYLWVARMIFSGLYFMEEVPFKDVLIHGIVRDPSGKKMSKSLGNVVDPLDLIESYGADALRFSLASSATSGNDVNFSDDRIEGARNFANKLWNATRFVIRSVGEERPGLGDEADLQVEDRWILSRLDGTLAAFDAHLDGYNLAEAMRTLHQFIWSEFCDWYIELAKMRLAGDDAPITKGVLVHVLDSALRALHPVMPFVTEELWQRAAPGRGSIMTADWPADEGREDLEVEALMRRFQDLVITLRRAKIEQGIPQGKRISVSVAGGAYASEIKTMSAAIMSLARLERIELVDGLEGDAATAKVMTTAGIECSLDLDGSVDVDAERARLQASSAESASWRTTALCRRPPRPWSRKSEPSWPSIGLRKRSSRHNYTPPAPR
jgi:valyl-tRNA synthetase